MTKHYQTPPLLEAVYEFKFQPAAKRNPAIPDLIYEKVQARFPERKQMSSTDGQEPALGKKTKFRRADGSALLQVAARFLPATSCASACPLIFLPSKNNLALHS